MLRRHQFKIFAVMSLGLSIAFGFQNCSTDFDFAANERYYELEFFGSNDFRTVQLNPAVDESRPDIDLTTIMDNSLSMRPIQSQVVNSFQSVSGQLRGFGGVAKILSTTHDNTGIKNSSVATRVIESTDPVTGEVRVYANVADVPAPQAYREVTRYVSIGSLVPEIRFDSRSSDEDFNAFVADYSAAIGSVIPTSEQVFGRVIADRDLTAAQIAQMYGSDKEQGFCTLLQELAKPKVAGRYYSYILATDDDDYTDEQSCIARLEQLIEKTPVVTGTDACQPGDAGCLFDYSIRFHPPKRRVASYDERQINEYIRFDRARPTARVLTEFAFPRRSEFWRVQLRERRETLRWQVAESREGILFPTGNYQTSLLNDWGVGSCTAGATRACSSAEAARVSGLSVAGSCQVTCEGRNQAVRVDRVSNASFSVPGSCSSAGIQPAVNCDAAMAGTAISKLYGLPAGSVPMTSVALCERTCTNTTSTSSTNLEAAVGSTCSSLGITNEQGSSQVCSSAQRTAAAASVPLQTSQLSSCNVSCEDQTHYQFDSNVTPNQCPGIAANGSNAFAVYAYCEPGTVYRTEADRLLAANGLTSSDVGFYCKHNCLQSIQTVTGRLLENNSSCELGSVAECTVDQRNSIGVPNGRYVAGTCQVRCENSTNSVQTYRKLAVASTNLCDINTPEGLAFQAEASAAQPTLQVNMATCTRSAGRRPSAIVGYTNSPQPQRIISLLQAGRSKVEVLEQALRMAHGNQFFIGVFLNNGTDSACLASAQGSRRESTAYMQLIDRLGERNGQYFSVCSPSYSAGLRSIFDTIVREVRRNYTIDDLDVTKGDFVYKVSAIEKATGQQIVVDPSQYIVEGTLIRFNDPKYLESLEQVNIEIGRPKERSQVL